jgi:UDP-N-acetylglucosamine 1-carboxyvinyltransferase
LQGADIVLPIRSTGATENAIICGSLAEGTTRVWNPHIRPEILDLISLLREMGAVIHVYGQEHIEINGTEYLSGTRHRTIPDNMEAITWLIGSVITNGDVEILDFPFSHLEVPLVHLRESGAKYYRGDDRLIVRGGRCYPIDISTGPYPGINSDMQPLFAVYAICARGESRIIDLRFPGRYKYMKELNKMGAECKIVDNLLSIKGGCELKGARVKAVDLRAGVALALLALVADGETCIEDAWQIDRGYNAFQKKMSDLDSDIAAFP